MALDDLINPQNVLDDVIRQNAPDLAPAGAPVNPQGMMDRLIRQNVYGRRPSAPSAPSATPAPPAAPSDFGKFGRDPGQDSPQDFGKFGRDPEETQPQPPQAAPETPSSLSEGAGVMARSAGQAAVQSVGEGIKAGALAPELKKAARDELPPEQTGEAANPDYPAVAAPYGREVRAREKLQAQARQREQEAITQAGPIAQRPIYKAGQAVQDFAKNWVTQQEQAKYPIASGIGSTVGGAVPALAAGAVGSLVGQPELGLLGAGGLMGAQAAGGTFDRASQVIDDEIAKARKAGNDELAAHLTAGKDEIAAKAAGLSGVVNGAMGVLPIGSVLAPAKQIAPGMVGRLWAMADHFWKSGVTFAGIGEAQQAIGEQLAKEYDPKAHYDFDYKRLIAEFVGGGALGAAHGAIQGRPQELRSGAEGDASNPNTDTGTGPTPGLTPPGEAAAETGAGPSASSAPPFKTGLNPKVRSTLEEKAAYYGEHDASDIASWSDDRLKDYVNTKGGMGSQASDEEILRRAGMTDDEIGGLSPQQRKATADEARGYGVHAAATPPEEGTRDAPIAAESAEDVARAAATAKEDHTPAQGEANNIQRGHMVWPPDGPDQLGITLEVKAGGTRRGTNPETGKPWETQHPHAYGYFKGLPKGADGDAPDVTVGDHPTAPSVFVLDEVDNKTGQFRQTKSFVGFQTWQDALGSYLATSSKDVSHVGGMKAFARADFIAMAKAGGLGKPVSEGMQPAGNVDLNVNNAAQATVAPTNNVSAGPEHRAAVEDTLRAAGIPPASVAPADLDRAAQIHAAEGAPPDQAFQVAVARSLIEGGYISPEVAREVIGDAETTALLATGEGAGREPPAQASGAAAGGETAAGPHDVAEGGAEARSRGRSNEGAEAAEAQPRATETTEDRGAGAGRNGRDDTTGGKRDAADRAKPAGAKPESAVQAARPEAAGNAAEAALIGERVAKIPEHKVTAADGTKIETVPVVVEAKDLITSADRGYDKSLQPRQRDRAASQAQIREIATRLDPERLGYSAEADRGAPIVGPDRLVESGNGRVAALRALYGVKNAPNARKYKAWLAEQGVDVSKYKEPVLVRQRVTDLSSDKRKAFTVAANQAATLSMSAPERALADARHLTPRVLGLIEDAGNLGAASNRAFARAFVAAIPSSERGALTDAQGQLSLEGTTRARNAVLARAYRDADVLSRITESTDDEVKSISNALVIAAPQWAALRADIDAGRVRSDVDATDELMRAVKQTADIRANGQKLEDHLAQHDAFDTLPGMVEAWMRLFYNASGKRAASASHISKGLRFYAEEAAKASNDPTLDMGAPDVTAEDIQHAAIAKAQGVPVGETGGGGGPHGDANGRGGSRSGAGGQEPAGANHELRVGFAEDTNLFTERTAAGDQHILPGAERISSAELAKRRAAQPLRPKKPQRPIEEGLFGNESRQGDLLARARPASKNKDMPAKIKSFEEIRSLLEKHGTVFLRWSASLSHDLKPGAQSKDYQSGDYHAGLSAMAIEPDLSDHYIFRFIRDYGFVRSSGNEDAVPRLFTGEVVGKDSDGADSIKVREYLGTLSDDFIRFIDDDTNLQRMDLAADLKQGKAALALYEKEPPKYISPWTPERVAEIERKLAELGGPPIMPGRAATKATGGPGKTGASAVSGVANGAPDQARALGPTNPPPPAEGMVRLYRGGGSNRGGPKWVTTDRRYAESYVTPGVTVPLKAGSHLQYVDVSKDDPRVRIPPGHKEVSFEAAPDIADRLQPYWSHPVGQNAIAGRAGEGDGNASGRVVEAATKEVAARTGPEIKEIREQRRARSRQLTEAKQARETGPSDSPSFHGFAEASWWKNAPPSETNYVAQAMRNLRETSRTASGVLDTSSTAGKSEQLVAGLTGEQAGARAVANYEKVVSSLFKQRHDLPKTGKAMSSFIDDVAARVNNGIVKPGNLTRSTDTKFPNQTAASDLAIAHRQFSRELAKRLADPNADPIETAAWIEWRSNLMDHFWSDGVGKTSKALAALPLMRAGLSLPHYPPSKEFFAFAKSQPRVDPRMGGNAYLGLPWEKFNASYHDMVEPERSLRRLLDQSAPVETLIQHPMVLRAVEENRSRVPTGTDEDFRNPEWRAARVYDFNGETVRGWEPAVARLVEQAGAYAGGPVARERHAVIVLGPPAAGKSATSGPIARAIKGAIVDADDAKLVIPEYQGGLGTNAVHEESSVLSKDVLKEILRDGGNLVLPKVGESIESIRRLMDGLKALGYTVDLAHVAATPEISQRRNIARFLETGRLVDPKYIAAVGDKPRANAYILKGEAHDFVDVDTSEKPSKIQGSGAIANVLRNGGDDEQAPDRGGGGVAGREGQAQGLTGFAENAPWLYSALDRAITSVKQEKAAPSHWLGTLRNAPGVKAEEMEWLGLPDWLRDQKGPVTKQEMLDYVRAHRVDVREVTKGKSGLSAAEQAELNYLRRREQSGDTTLAAWHRVGTLEHQEAYGETKFGSYTLPGGENYREMLLTLPDRVRPGARVLTREETAQLRPDMQGRLQSPFYAVDDSGRLGGFATEEEARANLPKDGVNYKSSHWDEPNILSHIRFNDRMIDGKKTLFIEEVQSDWHQAGKRKGYQGDTQGWSAEQVASGTYVIRDARGLIIDNAAANTPEEAIGYASKRSSAVPDAPFKTTWPELALKRMLRYAAEHGYEKLAWTPGDVQAERYDLSKQIKEIEYIKNSDGTYQLGVTGNNGDGVPIPNSDRMTLQDIEETVGKEIAEKIQNGDGRKYRGHDGYTLEGLDLKVGGEGMAGFYDKILPAAANKLIKKFGGKVGRSAIEYLDQNDRDIPFVIRDRDGAVDETGIFDENYAEMRASEIRGTYELDRTAGETKTVPVHTVDITHQLRDAALNQGFALFENRGALNRGSAESRLDRVNRQAAARAAAAIDAINAIPDDAAPGPPFNPIPRLPLGRQGQAHVLMHGRATGREHLIGIDASGKTIANVRGQEKFVGLTASVMKVLDDPNSSVVIHHNHPGGMGFSTADLAMLGSPGLSAVWAHGHGGDTYRAALTPVAQAAFKKATPEQVRKSLYRIATAIQHALYDPIQIAILFQGRVSMDDAMSITPHATAVAMQRGGIIDYRTTASLDHLIDEFGLDPIIEKAARAAAGALHVPGFPTGRNDRRPEPLRHVGDLGTTLDPGQGLAGRDREQARDDRQRGKVDRAQAAAQLRLPGFAEGGGPSFRTAAGGAGGAAPPPGGATSAATSPPPRRGPRPLTGALMRTSSAKAFKNFWTSTFQPELVSDRAFAADPLFAKYKSASIQEKDALYKASESEWHYWNKRPDSERIRFLDDMETAQFGAMPSDPQQAAMAKRYRRMLDANWAEEKKWGSQAAFVEDYFPHIWEKPSEWEAFSATKSAQVGPTWFQKKRTIDYITDGLAAGLKLKYTNPVDIVVHRLLSGVDMRQRMQLLYGLKDMGLAWEGAQGGEPLVARGWRAIVAPDRKQWVIAPDAQLLWKNAVEAKGMWQAEHLGGSMFRGWMALKNAWVPVKLALSAFHPLHVLHINYSDGMARAWGDVVQGRDPIQALRSLGQGFFGPMQAAPGASAGAIAGAALGAVTPVGPYWGGLAGSIAGSAIYAGAKRAGMTAVPHIGHQARVAWMKRPSAQSPEDKASVALMTEGGFVPQLPEQIKIAAKRELATAWQKVLRKEAGVSEWRKLITSSLRRPIEALQAPIFEEWIPNVKTAAYLNEAAALLRRQPELLSDDEQRGIALRGIALQVDSRFGEKFYGGMFWNRYLKDTAIGSFLSLGWNYGFVHQFGGAAMQAVSRPLGALPPFRPSEGRVTRRKATNAMAFALAYLGSAALINGLMTLAYTGDAPQGLDYIFGRIGGLNPDGTPRRITNMFYLREWPTLVKHVQERGGNWLSGAYEMLTNKLMFEPFKELLNNRTYFGYDVYDENAPIYQQMWQAFSHTIGDQTNPMSISGAKRAAELSGKPFPTFAESIADPGRLLQSLTSPGVGESVMGFGPAPAYIEKSAIQNRIGYLYGLHVAPTSRSEEEGEKSIAKMSVRTAIMLARQNKDSKGLSAAYERGKAIGLTPKYMNSVGREPTDLYLFSRLPDADQKAILRDASPEEYKRYIARAHKAVQAERSRNAGAGVAR